MSGHIVDRWMIPDPARPGRKVRGPRWGKGQRWAVRWSEGGRERQRAAPSKDAAEVILREVQHALALGTVTTRAKAPTVGEVAARWQAAAVRRESTKAWHEGLLARWILPRWEAVPVGEVTLADVREWYGDLRAYRAPKDEGRVRKGAALSTSRLRGIVLTFSAVMRHAVEGGHIPGNPCAGLRLPAARGGSTALEDDELDRLFVALVAISPNAAALAALMAHAGLRTGEAIDLDVPELDVAARLLTVDSAQTLVQGRRVRGATKTGNARVVPLPAACLAYLLPVVGERTSGPLVPGPRGGRYAMATWRRQWDAALTAAEIGRPVRPHDLRHTYASRLLDRGATLPDVQGLVGHARLSTTADIYGHRLGGVDRLARAVALLDAPDVQQTRTAPPAEAGNGA